jgi:hypothetical protein
MAPRTHAVLAIDDDDIEDRGAVLEAFATEHGVPFELLRLPRKDVPVLAPLEGAEAGDAARAIIVFASARAWKGCAGVSPACRELVASVRKTLLDRGEQPTVLWLTPRPENATDAHLPGTGPQVEEAIAYRLFQAADLPAWDLLT